MERIEPAAWTDDDRALWARIAAHDFEAATAALTFAGRLARDHGWSLEAARAAIDEYRRFCFLALRPGTAGAEVTPSEEVDEVWHQHLAYSRDYWQVWCREVLRRDLHHGPTLGGPAEGRRFAEQYAGTLAAYEAWFGPPPADLWPGTAERFGRPRFHLVDRLTHVAVPIPAGARLRRLARAPGLGAILAVLSTRPAAASGLNPLDWTAGPFLALYVALACASLAAALKTSSWLRRRAPRVEGRSRLTPAELGFLSAGSTRAADVFILERIAAGRIELGDRVRRLGPLSSRSDVLTQGGQDVTRAWLAADRADEIAHLRGGLIDGGFILPDARRRSIHRATAILVGPVLLLGLAKLAVGAERDKPVGLLLFLLGATAVAALVVAASRSHLSETGRALLEDHKVEHARALRAPRAEEVIAAFAVVGVAALAGTAFEAYGRVISAADGGGCGGGGDGGGGCGGCGGGA